MVRPQPRSTRTYTLFPDTTRSRSRAGRQRPRPHRHAHAPQALPASHLPYHRRCRRPDGATLRRAARRAMKQRFVRLDDDLDDEEELILRGGDLDPAISDRSEVHTSELQSLMRISYAVFCLKNKNKT